MSTWEFITNSKKKSISNKTWFFVEFELDFYFLYCLQKSISKSNRFFDFLNLIFQNWKKIDWHSIFQKSSGDRQGNSIVLTCVFTSFYSTLSSQKSRQLSWLELLSSKLEVVCSNLTRSNRIFCYFSLYALPFKLLFPYLPKGIFPFPFKHR